MYVGVSKYGEKASFMRKMLEYVHLQMISLVTNQINLSLEDMPNLDVRSNISNLEQPMVMMSEMV